MQTTLHMKLLTFLRCACLHKAANSPFHVLFSEEGTLDPSRRRTRAVGDKRKAHITPVHATEFLGQIYLSMSFVGTRLTKTDKDQVRRPGNTTSSRIGIIRGEVDCAADNTARVTHGGPNSCGLLMRISPLRVFEADLPR